MPRGEPWPVLDYGQLGGRADAGAETYRIASAMAHHEQVGRVGAELDELAGALEEWRTRRREQDIAPMRDKDVAVVLAASRRDDDFDLTRHSA